MEKKLYRVKVVLYVMAENEFDARAVATNVHFDIFECEAQKAKTVDPGWEDAIPYNSEDDRTCSYIMRHTRQVPAPAAQAVSRYLN